MAFTAEDLISKVQNRLTLKEQLGVHPTRRNALVWGTYDGLKVGEWLLLNGVTAYIPNLCLLLMNTERPLAQILAEINNELDEEAKIPLGLFKKSAYRTGKFGPADYIEGMEMGYHYTLHLYLAYLGYATKKEAIRFALKRIPAFQHQLENLEVYFV